MSLSTSNLPSTNGLQAASPVSFNLQGTYGQQPQVSQSPPPASQSAPPGRQSTMPAVKTRADEENAKLAGLLANREEGIDTFGNFGALRSVAFRVSVLCAFIKLHAGTDSRRGTTWRRSRQATTRSRTSSNSSSRARINPSSRSRLQDTLPTASLVAPVRAPSLSFSRWFRPATSYTHSCRLVPALPPMRNDRPPRGLYPLTLFVWFCS